MCQDLSADHEITFIAGPSYHVRTRPRAIWTREQFGRVSIIRTWGTRFPKHSLPLRMTNLGTYYFLAAIAAFRDQRPDIIVAETDPPLLGALGAMLKWRWGSRLVYNVRDLYPDIALATGAVKNRALLGLLEFGNRVAYKAADRVIVVGRDMERRIIAKGVAPERIEVVPDWVDCDQIRPLESNPLRNEFGDKFVVMYSGNLGVSQNLEMILEAAARLRDDSRIVFALIGEGARKPALMARAKELALSNVVFMPYRPKEQLAESLSAADLHLIPLSAGTTGCLVPSKIYGILAAGRPFIAMMDQAAEVACLAREHRVGYVVRPGNDVELADTIVRAMKRPTELKQMGARARDLARDRFDRKAATRRFAEMLAKVASRPRVDRSMPESPADAFAID